MQRLALNVAAITFSIAIVACGTDSSPREQRPEAKPDLRPKDFASDAAISAAERAFKGVLAPPICPTPTYAQPNPDRLDDMWKGRSRWRLVIGAGKYRLDSAFDRPLVAATARAVDRALQGAGYAQSLGLLLDDDATTDNIDKAIRKIGSLPKNALVVIYYIGHGIPLDDDLALAVADRKVNTLGGISVRQLFTDALKPFDPQFRKIPRIIFVLETCYSGAAKPLSASRFVSGKDEFKRLAFLSATSDNEEALPIAAEKEYAFGHFFARALQADWACADRTADGALTAYEMRSYLAEKLKAASAQNLIAGKMTPGLGDAGLYSTIAYDGSRVADKTGYRDEIVDLYLEPGPGVTASLRGEEGSEFARCESKCAIPTDSPAQTVATFALPGFAERSIPVKEVMSGERRDISISLGPPGLTQLLGSVQVMKRVQR